VLGAQGMWLHGDRDCGSHTAGGATEAAEEGSVTIEGF
jgi:hypothetical protein